MRRSWIRDPILVILVASGVLVGTVAGLRSRQEDVDERLFHSIIVQMRSGDGYYEAAAAAVREKSGVGPSQVRSIRPPVLAATLRLFPPAWWRWLALIPAAGLCLAAAALAGPELLARRIAGGMASLWMLVSLPLLHLHHELWGGALVMAGALEMRRHRDGRAALWCLIATLVRELFGLSLVAGLLLGRDRRPWVAALGATGVFAVLHVMGARPVLDPRGMDPPLRALESYFKYVAPGSGPAARVVGVALLAFAVGGFWIRRHTTEFRFLALVVVPLVVATAAAGRSYWSLTWCGPTSAAGALAVSSLVGLARTRMGRSAA